jgi:hypothetical protein
MEQVLTHEPGYVTRLYEWMMGPTDAGLVKFVGRQESLVDDLCNVLRTLGYRTDEERIRSLPAENVSPGMVSQNESLRDRILATEASAIERYYPRS